MSSAPAFHNGRNWAYPLFYKHVDCSQDDLNSCALAGSFAWKSTASFVSAPLGAPESLQDERRDFHWYLSLVPTRLRLHISSVLPIQFKWSNVASCRGSSQWSSPCEGINKGVGFWVRVKCAEEVKQGNYNDCAWDITFQMWRWPFRRVTKHSLRTWWLMCRATRSGCLGNPSFARRSSASILKTPLFLTNRITLSVSMWTARLRPDDRKYTSWPASCMSTMLSSGFNTFVTCNLAHHMTPSFSVRWRNRSRWLTRGLPLHAWVLRVHHRVVLAELSGPNWQRPSWSVRSLPQRRYPSSRGCPCARLLSSWRDLQLPFRAPPMKLTQRNVHPASWRCFSHSLCGQSHRTWRGPSEPCRRCSCRCPSLRILHQTCPCPSHMEVDLFFFLKRRNKGMNTLIRGDKERQHSAEIKIQFDLHGAKTLNIPWPWKQWAH